MWAGNQEAYNEIASRLVNNNGRHNQNEYYEVLLQGAMLDKLLEFRCHAQLKTTPQFRTAHSDSIDGSAKYTGNTRPCISSYGRCYMVCGAV